MIGRPLFWLYLFLQFHIFIYLTNRIGIRQHKRINEILWLILFLAGQLIPSFFLIRAWDFTPTAWVHLNPGWKFLTSGVFLWVFTLYMDHGFWLLFRKKPVKTRVLFKRYPLTHVFPAPFSFLRFIGFENQIYDLEVSEVEVFLLNWPKAWDGLSLVQISDLHYGLYIHDDYLKAIVAEAKNLKPDLFALTGDFISFKKDVPRMRTLLKGLRAPLGSYAVLGNHDLWADGPGLQKVLADDGIRVLRNEVVYLLRGKEKLALMGVDDIWLGKRNDQPILAAKAEAKILLAHQPDHFYLAKKSGAQLQLSGHCHGGQICFPILGPLVVPADEGRKYAGGFIREKESTLFIHRGIGGYPPLRTYCRPQVVKLVLKSIGG